MTEKKFLCFFFWIPKYFVFFLNWVFSNHIILQALCISFFPQILPINFFQDACRMLVELSTLCDSSVAIDRILPYFVHLWADPETQVSDENLKIKKIENVKKVKKHFFWKFEIFPKKKFFFSFLKFFSLQNKFPKSIFHINRCSIPKKIQIWNFQVRATGITATAELLAPIQPKTYEEALVFVDYLFPQLVSFLITLSPSYQKPLSPPSSSLTPFCIDSERHGERLGRLSPTHALRHRNLTRLLCWYGLSIPYQWPRDQISITVWWWW